MRLYPTHLRLEGREALVVGGGPVAASKIAGLLVGGARVRVVAPELSAETTELIRVHAIPVEERCFRRSDLDGAWIVIGATGDPKVQQELWEESRRRNLLVCLVDDPERSNFVAPAVLRRGSLIVTVSTSGKAPALAARLRDFLGEIFRDDFGDFLEKVGEVREEFRRRHTDFGERREAWYRWIDSEILPALRGGRTPAVHAANSKVGEGERAR